jgi:tRNA-specific 2-thiouridylase
VAQQLGIDHLVFNFSEDFTAHVVAPYVADHVAGRTPNPCVECNRHLKFDRLLHRGELLGFDAVATGHHARIETGPGAGGGLCVARGADRAKDQSYVLSMLSQDQLRRLRFPVGLMTKAEVRDRAAALGLRTAAKPDSQDVCFITRAGRAAFIGARAELHPGRVVDEAGQELGTVPAVELVTLGQRRGLGGAGGSDRRYVVGVDVPGRTVVVGAPEALRAGSQPIAGVAWTGGPAAAPGGTVLVQCNAHGAVVPAVVSGDVVAWEAPQRRVAPGQSIVFYDATDRYVLGGAVAAAG